MIPCDTLSRSLAPVTSIPNASSRTEGPSVDPLTLESGLTSEPHTCRCGTRIESGRPAVEIVGLSVYLVPLFPEPTFCSSRCVRAEILEKRELLDAMIGSPAESLVTDLELTYREFNRAFQALPGEPRVRSRA